MTTRSKSQFQSRTLLLTAFAALVTAVPAFPQGASNSAVVQEGGYSLIDITAFFGTQWYQLYHDGNGSPNIHSFQARPIVGERITENVTKYFSVEEGFGLGFNRLNLLPLGGNLYVTSGARNIQYSLAGRMNFAPRDARFRPYIVLGAAAVDYVPTGSLQIPAGESVAVQPVNLQRRLTAAMVYGLGAEFNLNRRIAFQYDVRGNVSNKAANFGLPAGPGGPGATPGNSGSPAAIGPGSLYVPNNHGESSLAFTTGIVFRFGYVEPPAPYVAPPPPPPPPPPVAVTPPTITLAAIQGAHDVCQGDNIQLRVTASVAPPGALTYAWAVNNLPAPGGNGAAFNLPTTTAGAKVIRVTASSPGATSAVSGAVNVVVRGLAPPTIQFNVNPATIAYGDRLPLNAQAQVSDCAQATPVRYTASAGNVAGTTFDSSALTFNPNGAGVQQQVVQITATETDSKNQTATQVRPVTVVYRRAPDRTDIVFPNRSARVNNAAKRYLIEILTPRLRADPDAKVILIGHRDMGETGRPAATLDTQRVLNAAAVLSAGKGICPQLDLSRIQVKSDGTDQADPPMPFADNSVKERTGQGATDQAARFRRVEVWYIPGGVDVPAGVTGLQPAPVKDIQAKGCPR